MDLLYPVLRTLLICLVGFGIAYQGRRKGYTIFNLSGRFNRLQFIILFIAMMILLLYRPLSSRNVLLGLRCNAASILVDYASLL